MSTRSHHACWTCKRRRRRCDNARPGCQNCAKRGVECEGYEVRLRWGSGIASRGRFTGADKPLVERVPPRPRGRQRDRERERKKLEAQLQNDLQGDLQKDLDCHAVVPPLGEDVSKTKGTTQDEIIFDEFMNNGINVLHSTSAHKSMLKGRIPQLCEESSALYTICLTFQLSLSATHTARFFEYFDASLREFRSELARSTILSDGTLTAGLLLCSIGLMHGLPWTMHLAGMHNILQSNGLNNQNQYPPTAPSEFRFHSLEVMGVMDLPCFAVGRQTPCIGIWRRYRQPTSPRHGIEPVTGLPRSLLDLFAGIGLGTTEQSFWDWPGEPGSFLQCYLWEAHRLAGILTIRRNSRFGKHRPGEVQGLPASRQSNACPADNTTLVARVLANLDALRLACAERPTEEPFIKNAMILPSFTAGLEVSTICRNPQWQQTIRDCSQGSRQEKILLGLLEEMWQRNDPTLDVDDLARERGLEMGLL